MEKSHTMAVHGRTVRGRRFTDRFMATARSAFYPVERVVMPLIGIEQFVRLRHALASSDVSQM
jgi:hypothetical protein